MANIKLSTYLGGTESDIKKAMASQITTPEHSLNDDTYTTGSRQSITAATEYAFECNAAFEKTNFPFYITKLWDITTNKCYFDEVLDTPMYVARVQFNFDPTVASTGLVEIKAWIDDATPKLIQTIRVPYKAVDSRMEALFAFYIGSETGYDMKVDGLKFTYEAIGAGEIYNRAILIYRT